MPKLKINKTKKSVTKRLTVNKNGVVKHGISYKRHSMYGRSSRRIRQHGTTIASKQMIKVLKKVCYII